jgi:hypothetical protein
MRSGALIPRSRIDSNAMLIWWGCADGNRAFNDNFRGLVIWLLLDDVGIAMGASPKSAFKEQSVQIPQGARRNARRSELHAGADTGVKHPSRQYRYDAWCDLDMDNAAANPLFAVLRPQTAPVKRVPTIVNFNFLPDMGRMSM